MIVFFFLFCFLAEVMMEFCKKKLVNAKIDEASKIKQM